MKRRSILKTISILLGTILGLLLAEGSFRLWHCLAHHDLDDIESGNRPPVIRPNQELTLGQIIQLSSNPKIIYELIPSSAYRFRGVTVETNERGFRDRSYPRSKAQRSRRIIGLGDSVMFGWGVREEEGYASLLERLLNEEGSVPYEVINTAVPGYNTVMEVETLRTKVMLEEVDLVVINFVPNDFDLPNFIRKKPNYLGVDESLILQLFANNGGFDRRLVDAPFDDEQRRYHNEPDKVPEEYKDMVGEASYIRAMSTLKTLSDRHGFRVIVLSHSPWIEPPEVVTGIAAELGFEFLDTKPHWLKYKKDNPSAEWKLTPDDWHPTTDGHQVIAQALAEKVGSLFDDVTGVVTTNGALHENPRPLPVPLRQDWSLAEAEAPVQRYRAPRVNRPAA